MEDFYNNTYGSFQKIINGVIDDNEYHFIKELILTNYEERIRKMATGFSKAIYEKIKDRKELELMRLKLMNQVFKMMPNSPKQLAIRKEREKIHSMLNKG